MKRAVAYSTSGALSLSSKGLILAAYPLRGEMSKPGFSIIKNRASVTPDGNLGVCGIMATTLRICLTSTTQISASREHDTTVCDEIWRRSSSGREYRQMMATSAKRQSRSSSTSASTDSLVKYKTSLNQICPSYFSYSTSVFYKM
jgi:hypothetical protein